MLSFKLENFSSVCASFIGDHRNVAKREREREKRREERRREEERGSKHTQDDSDLAGKLI